jgi:uncharacterized protein (TIGR03435 family)
VVRKFFAALLAAACAGLGQTGGAPSFEVVSVKPAAAPISTKDDYTAGYNAGMRAALASFGIRVVGRRVTVTDATLRDLIRLSYQVKDYQVVGPPWMAGEKFEVAATMPEGAGKEQAPLMMQTMLAERFHLKLHRELRELPVYALVADPKGTRLKPAPEGRSVHVDAPDAAPGMRQLHARGALSVLADNLTKLLNKPVIDLTGIPGAYDFELTYQPDPNASEGDMGPSLTEALRQQLGLRLESRKSKLEVLVVDAVDRRPTEN